MMKNDLKNKKILYTLIGIIAIFILWELLALLINQSILLPTPIETIEKAFSLVLEKETHIAFFNTGLRAIIGFLVAFILGAIFGIIASQSYPFKCAFAPFISVLRATPTMSIILLAVIWFNPDVSPAFIGFLIIFPIIYERFYSALLSIDPKLIEMSKVYNVSKKDKIIKLYLPSIRKSVLSMAKSAISLNVKVVIAGEVLAYTAKSIGMQMYITKLDIATASLFAWTIYALMLSLIFECVIMLIDHLTDPVKIRNRKIKKQC